MTDAVERAARAMAEADPLRIPFDDLGKASRELLIAYARAAIAAMREPTEAMQDAATSYGFAAGFGRPVYTPGAHWCEQWRRSIDAALKP